MDFLFNCIYIDIQYTCIFLLTDGSKNKFCDLCLKFRSRNLVMYLLTPYSTPPPCCIHPSFRTHRHALCSLSFRIYLFCLPCNDSGWLNILKFHIFLRTKVNEVGENINVLFSLRLSILMVRDSETYSSPFSVSMLSRVECGPLFYFLSCSEVHTKMPELTLLHLWCYQKRNIFTLNKSNKKTG